MTGTDKAQVALSTFQGLLESVLAPLSGSEHSTKNNLKFAANSACACCVQESAFFMQQPHLFPAYAKHEKQVSKPL